MRIKIITILNNLAYFCHFLLNSTKDVKPKKNQSHQQLSLISQAELQQPNSSPRSHKKTKHSKSQHSRNLEIS